MSAPPQPQVNPVSVEQEYSIIMRKDSDKTFNVMRFNGNNLDTDCANWSQAKMGRENNLIELEGGYEDTKMPKFRAESTFRQEAREEARRKKLGILKKEYRSQEPWILTSGGKTEKKFKGVREGAFNENSTYYVFVEKDNDTVEAFPLSEWYNFQPIQTYKALSVEEAEKEFSRRDLMVNRWNVMLKKRTNSEKDDAELDGVVKKKDLKISEMEDWMDSEDDDSSSNEEDKSNESDDKDNKKRIKRTAGNENGGNVNHEAFEESDDGDEEGREREYITDSSDSENELVEDRGAEKSVDEEAGLRKLLASDEEDDEDQDDENDEDEDEKASRDVKDEKEKKMKTKNQVALKKSSSSGVSKSQMGAKKLNGASSFPSACVATAAVAPKKEAMKRKKISFNHLQKTQKPKLENSSPVPVSSNTPKDTGFEITEDAVRKYLSRKPMTAKSLLLGFKKKEWDPNQVLERLREILKKIKPAQTKINNLIYWSLPPKKQ